MTFSYDRDGNLSIVIERKNPAIEKNKKYFITQLIILLEKMIDIL